MRPPTLGDSYWLARGIFRPVAKTRTWARLYAYEARFWEWFREWSGEKSSLEAGMRIGSYRGFKRGYRLGVRLAFGRSVSPAPVPEDGDVQAWWMLHDLEPERCVYCVHAAHEGRACAAIADQDVRCLCGVVVRRGELRHV